MSKANNYFISESEFCINFSDSFEKIHQSKDTGNSNLLDQ